MEGHHRYEVNEALIVFKSMIFHFILFRTTGLAMTRDRRETESMAGL
jgi:hypothetical protein